MSPLAISQLDSASASPPAPLVPFSARFLPVLTLILPIAI
jgi:hypothetical protein